MVQRVSVAGRNSFNRRERIEPLSLDLPRYFCTLRHIAFGPSALLITKIQSSCAGKFNRMDQLAVN
jgi:hypothetical protein